MLSSMTFIWATVTQAPDLHVEVDWAQLSAVARVYSILFLAGLILNALFVWRFLRSHDVWHRNVRCLLRRPWTWVDVAQVVSLLLLLHLLVLGIMRTAQWLDRWPDGPASTMWIVLHSLALHWTAIAAIWLLALRRGISWRVGFAHRDWRSRDNLQHGVAAYLMAVPYLLIYAAIYYAWLQWTGRDPTPQDVVVLFQDMEYGFLYFYLGGLAILVAPVSEELLFRGLLLPLLARRLGVGAAVVGSSLVFALVHFHVPSLVPLFVFSVALSLAYIHTRSILTPIVMHGLFNAVSLWTSSQLAL